LCPSVVKLPIFKYPNPGWILIILSSRENFVVTYQDGNEDLDLNFIIFFKGIVREPINVKSSNLFFKKKYGQSFPPNWVGGISFNLVYKSDMCLLTCEMHMFF
jgi:hypothetical protein